MYRQKTLEMLKMVNKTGNINIIKDFFAQLAKMDDLEIFPIINAISSKSNDLNQLIFNSIQIKPWMHKISLEDIRNIVVFILWRDYKIICSLDAKYIPDSKDIQCLIKPSNGFTERLITLLESCFYVKQIYHVKCNQIPENWDRFIPWIHLYYNKYGLIEIVHSLGKLIIPLQKLF